MLKWFNKVKNWLQGEEIVEIEEVILVDSIEDEKIQKSTQTNHASISHQRNAQQSDPDTNVLYQYPKGQFKFPLIPDERPLSKRKPSEKVWEEKPLQVPTRRKNRSSVVNTREVASEPKRKIGSPKKPFRPTEIPSPVYGFQSRQKHIPEKAVEFELESDRAVSHDREPTLDAPAFSQENKQLNEQPILESVQQQVSQNEIGAPVVSDKAVTEPISAVVSIEEEEVMSSDLVVEENIDSVPPVVVEKAVEFELESDHAVSHDREPTLDVPAFSQENKQLNEQPILESVQQQVSQNEIGAPVVSDEAVTEPISADLSIEEEKVISSDLVVEENIDSVPPVVVEKAVEFELESDHAVSHDREPTLDVPAFSQENKQLNEQPILESVQQQVSQNEIGAPVVSDEAVTEPISADLSIEEEKVMSSDLVVEENMDSVPPVVVEKEESVEAITTTEEKVETATKSTEITTVNEEVAINDIEKPRKKHIPFNVIMLKQDQKKEKFPNFKESEKKTELFQKVASPENKNSLQAIERKLEQEHTESSLHIVVPSETKQEAKMPEALLEENIEDKDSVQLGTQVEEENPYYVFPDLELLTPPTVSENDEEWLEEQTALLDETLINFNVRASVVNVTQGPAVTRFEVYPEPGVKVSKVTNLMDDIKLSLAARDMRMEAPIPGKHTIGIEIPNRKSKPVFLRELLESEAFQNHPSPLAVAMGLDISGQPVVTDLRKMPHGLIAGQTGSGKSVCINSMLVSLLYKATPQEVKLMLIDPKMVELAPYNRIPHLVSPVITDVKAATAALKWAVEEMERRYELFVHAGVRDITKFNENAEQAGQYANKLPYILIIIDELADLMMMSPADVEEAICRIAQKARACGIHLIVATQRPSVDVITGLIKANIPTRVAFSVSSQVDSRTIIDSAGAEKLLGRGDMLFAENGSSKTIRLQGTFVSDDEIDLVVGHVKKEQQPNYLFEQEELLNRAQVSEDTDELFFEACEYVVSQHSASTSSIQRRFRVGYNRAARLIEMMEQQGFISESRGSKPREVLISEEDLEYMDEANMVK